MIDSTTHGVDGIRRIQRFIGPRTEAYTLLRGAMNADANARLAALTPREATRPTSAEYVAAAR
ncbi:hypothetical protein [Cryobacterium psychrophilum]|uniref:Uncharacterized protein n=1 Tax=Cryobacterium psychrophilum TaxID=41988 RepID=A0A4Y8KSB3_9MICO|nr:hypothetical protein [Cryobacterium psychrophilum]TDW31005.1 hypothetical protein EDD25_2793 [Cryobacterium psychrophilum]TFD80863.1 hypothetical protein E3T53_04365 [Cryobacterium psychrophilum]